jgi:hypothetical protein
MTFDPSRLSMEAVIAEAERRKRDGVGTRVKGVVGGEPPAPVIAHARCHDDMGTMAVSPMPLPALLVDAIDQVPLEKSVQHEVRQLYEQAGCKVYNLSQARASKQTAGLADLWVAHRGAGAAWWHETKRPGGARTTAQNEFKDDCTATATGYVCGGVEAARRMLASLGLVPDAALTRGGRL